jgi:hypothetical protein
VRLWSSSMSFCARKGEGGAGRGARVSGRERGGRRAPDAAPAAGGWPRVARAAAVRAARGAPGRSAWPGRPGPGAWAPRQPAPRPPCSPVAMQRPAAAARMATPPAGPRPPRGHAQGLPDTTQSSIMARLVVQVGIGAEVVGKVGALGRVAVQLRQALSAGRCSAHGGSAEPRERPGSSYGAGCEGARSGEPGGRQI